MHFHPFNLTSLCQREASIALPKTSLRGSGKPLPFHIRQSFVRWLTNYRSRPKKRHRLPASAALLSIREGNSRDGTKDRYPYSFRVPADAVSPFRSSLGDDPSVYRVDARVLELLTAIGPELGRGRCGQCCRWRSQLGTCGLVEF